MLLVPAPVCSTFSSYTTIPSVVIILISLAFLNSTLNMPLLGLGCTVISGFPELTSLIPVAEESQSSLMPVKLASSAGV